MSSLFLMPDDGEKVTALGSTYRVKTNGSHVAMAYSVMEEEFWGDTTPLHNHPDAEEAFYVLGGQVEVWAEGAVSTASAGAFIVVPRGATHGLRRLSDEHVRMLTLISPPGFEKLFAVVAEAGWLGAPPLMAPEFHLGVAGLFLPVVLVLVAENIGHVKSVAQMTGESADALDHMLGRTLLSDGLANVGPVRQQVGR